MTLILVIIMFGLMIFPHELGHFIAAKACGVQVNEFAFGMGPAIFQKQGKETLYSVRLIMVGGYCAMEGEDEKSETENERALNNKKWWQKLIIMAAGAAMNILIAVIIYSVLVGISGMPTTTLEKTIEGSPAYEAGIKGGDEIVAVENERTKSWQDVIEKISTVKEGEAVSITVSRDGKELEKSIVPVYDKETERYMVGINSKLDHNPILAVKNGAIITCRMTGSIFDALANIFKSGNFRDSVSGPVGIISAVNDTSDYGFLYYMNLVGLISINLALFNLLPLPALDGGRILFIFIRMITGKAITDEMEGRIHSIGFMLIIAFAIFVTWNDIVRLLT